ncbi:uncharacterized protein LOC128228533 isoform X2 [Mya arenaria]|nr:uncharacterized protein LOC128228533 isoform X2 [Mya arenaria]
MAVFNSDESKNWLKQWMAVFITREGILPSVKAVSESMHTDILTKASNLQIATCTQDHGRITDNSPLHYPFHRLIRDEIKAIHKRIPSWRNSPTDTWYDTPFAISKLFMQASGYDDKTNFQDTDFNGIAAFVCNSGKFTQNVERISNEARKAVNKIRHTPNMLSNELTNQATHDCIAKLSALLNEQVFRGVPQVLRARKKLDELKTNFPDLNKELCKYIIDEVVSKGIQDISDLVTDEETQCRQDFDKRRADMETISNLFMSSITTQSECAIYDIRQTLDNSLKNLTMYIGNAKTVLKTTTEQAKRDVKEASEVGRHKLEMTTKELRRDLVRISDCTNLKLEEAASANKHTLEETTLVAQVQLEDTTMDGRKELVETPVAGKRELIETVIGGQRRLQQMLEEGLDGFIQTLKPQDEYDQAKAMSELRKHLSKHYERTAGQMKIRMEIDAAIEDIYEKPKLVFKIKTDQSENVVDVEISDINQMFMCGEGSLVKTIFVEGEAGSGKNQFVQKYSSTLE